MNKFMLGGAMGFMLAAGLGAGMMASPAGDQLKRDMKRKARVMKRKIQSL